MWLCMCNQSFDMEICMLETCPWTMPSFSGNAQHHTDWRTVPACIGMASSKYAYKIVGLRWSHAHLLIIIGLVISCMMNCDNSLSQNYPNVGYSWIKGNIMEELIYLLVRMCLITYKKMSKYYVINLIYCVMNLIYCVMNLMYQLDVFSNNFLQVSLHKCHGSISFCAVFIAHYHYCSVTVYTILM